MKYFFNVILLFTTISMLSQVGINTTTPSAAAVLEISSSSDNVNFGGFMPPRVSTTERDDIPVTAADEGLMVYVINPPNSQLQIWDGIAWQTLFPQRVEFSAILVAWDLEGLTNSGPPILNPSLISDAVSSGGLTKSSVITQAAAGDAWGGANWFDVGPNMPQDAIDAESFVTFTITPNFGVNVSLTTIEPYNIRRSPAGPTTGLWQYSIDGNNFIDIGSPITWGTINTAAGNPQFAIDLSGIGDLQNLSSTTTVTFRLVNWGASAAGGTWYINDQVAGPDLIIRGNLN